MSPTALRKVRKLDAEIRAVQVRRRHSLFTAQHAAFDRLRKPLGLQHRNGSLAVVDIVVGVGLALHQ